MKVAILLSSGKDSMLALHKAKEQGHEIVCLISMISENPASWMFHTPNIKLAEDQAKCLNLPIILKHTKGEKEIELEDLKEAIQEAKQKYNIEGIVSGALHSKYQWTRIDKICGDLELLSISPLWNYDQKELLIELINKNFKVIIVAVACDGLNKDWLGKEINTQTIQELDKLNKEIGINIAGEGGEYETLVLDCPLFTKSIEILKSEKKMENENTGYLDIQEIKLVEK